MARWRIVQLLPRAGGGLVGLLTVGNLALGVLPVAFVIATSVLLGRVPAAVKAAPTHGLNSAAWHSLVTVFLLATAAFVAQQIVAPIVTALGELVARRVDGEVFDELMAASLRTPGVVSHRFSTVRMADLIIVVQDGCVTETGSHKTLATSGGLYAELFAIRAATYR
jgi:ABC-type multidrug transport system fused ATPase/permease subunit